MAGVVRDTHHGRARRPEMRSLRVALAQVNINLSPFHAGKGELRRRGRTQSVSIDPGLNGLTPALPFPLCTLHKCAPESSGRMYVACSHTPC
jgi:hypothetical protein